MRGCYFWACVGALAFVVSGVAVFRQPMSVPPPSRTRSRAPTALLLHGRLDDRMDSYFLSETTKYLFLLFDSALLQTGHLALRNRTSGSGSPAPPVASPASAASRTEHGGVRGVPWACGLYGLAPSCWL